MNAHDHDEMLACKKYLQDKLSKTAKQRHRHDNWVEREQQAVTDSANRWARKHGLKVAVTFEQVVDLEVCAVGHIDYASKFCLYVAEYLYGVSPRQLRVAGAAF